MTTTTLTLNEKQLYILLSGLEAENTDYMDRDEYHAYDKMRNRLINAIDRLEDAMIIARLPKAIDRLKA
tara:strand:+ start:182 stop:388 length:207 start_codon:yes stop_codon:yes gene_type:complete